MKANGHAKNSFTGPMTVVSPRCVTVTGKTTFLRQDAEGLHVWQEPFVKLRAPMLTNLRMDPFELAPEIGMDYGQWFVEHMFLFAPAAGYVGQWLQSFKEFPPRQKPGSFNLDNVMEAVTSLAVQVSNNIVCSRG